MWEDLKEYIIETALYGIPTMVVLGIFYFIAYYFPLLGSSILGFLIGVICITIYYSGKGWLRVK